MHFTKVDIQKSLIDYQKTGYEVERKYALQSIIRRSARQYVGRRVTNDDFNELNIIISPY